MGIQIKRVSLTSSLPGSALDGQLLLAKDTQELYVGTGPSLVPLKIDASNIIGSSFNIALSQLTDVLISSPTDGQVLSYNSGAGKWENQSISGAVISVNGQTGVVVLTTSNIAEGSNLYFTTGRVDSEIDTHIGTKNAASGFAGLNGSTQLTVIPSSTASAHHFATAISASGALTYTQPDYSDLTGTPQQPITKAAVTSNFFTSYTSSTGLFTAAQPAFTDISGTASSAQIPSLAGDVTGNIASNSVVQIQGTGVDSVPPLDQQFLVFQSSTGKWEPTTIGFGSSTFYLDSTASDISTYFTLLNSFPTSGESTLSAVGNSGAGQVLAGAFATPSGQPASLLYSAGVWIMSIYASVDSLTQGPSMVVKAYNRVLAGTETLILTKIIPLTSTSTIVYQVGISEADFPTLATDRLVFKIYLQAGGASTRTLTIYFDGTTHVSAVRVPVDVINVIRAQSLAKVTHQWLDSYDATTGLFTQSQPGFTDVSGTAGLAQGGTGVDLSAAGGSGFVLKQNSSHVISAAALISSDIPNLDASKITTGTLALARGGTNADLSGTGGSSQVLRQSTVGAAITVSQLAYSDISGTPTLPSSAGPTSHQFFTSYTSSTGVFTLGQPAAADITGLAAIATSGKWSDLQNPSAALTLAMGTNSSTFNHTSSVNWTWANTTAATSTLSTPALVSSQFISAAGTGGQTNGSAINTVGATVLVCVLSGFGGQPVMSDGQSNTWNYTTVYNGFGGNGYVICVAYAYSHAGGALATSASHTFTGSCPAGSSFTASIYAISGTKTDATVFDTVVGCVTSASSPFQIGQITPSPGDFVITGITNGANFYNSASINQSFGNVFIGTVNSGAGALLLGATGVPLNPTWTFTGGGISIGVIASFRAAGTTVPASPPISIYNGTYWNGSASATDAWTCQPVVGTGSNPTSLFEFLHTGSTGPAAIQAPGLAIVDTAGNIDLSLTNTTASTSTTSQNSPGLTLMGSSFNGGNGGAGGSQPIAWTLQGLVATPHTSATVTNVAETAGNVVTLTITGGNFVAGDLITFTGLTQATWLNGVTATLTSGTATTLTFPDPTAHGLQASHVETGQVTQTNVISTLSLTFTGPGLAGFSIPTYLGSSGVNSGLILSSNYSFVANTAFTFNGPSSGCVYNFFAGVTPHFSLSIAGGANTIAVSTANDSLTYRGNITTSSGAATGIAHLFNNVSTMAGITNNGTQGLVQIQGTFAPNQQNTAFNALTVNPTINQPAAVTNTAVGSALVTNVGAIVFSTTSAYSAGAQILVALGTNTALNGYQTLVAQAQRAGSPYTITNSIENAGSTATLTIGTHSVVVGDWIFVTGLTTATWLNGQTVKVTAVAANSTVSFVDLTAHGTSATHADTGTITDNFMTFSLTHANITGSADTGTAVQQGVGNYTGVLVNIVETALGGTTNKLIDLQAGTTGGTSRFNIDNTGLISLPNSVNAGFGTGSAGTAVTTTTKGGGTGPTTPQTVVQYEKIIVNGSTYWIPLVQ